MNPRKFSLKNNALSSLGVFLDSWNSKETGKIRLAILMLDNFVELFFKSYIVKKHPLSVYEKPSDSKKTITLHQAIKRIEELDYKIQKNLEKDIKGLREWRNDLNHFESNLSPDDERIRLRMGRIIYDCLVFDEDNDNYFEGLSQLSAQQKSDLFYLKYNYEKHLKRAQEKAKEAAPYDDYKGSLDSVACPECNSFETSYITSAISKGYKMAHCCFCGETFSVQQCGWCGTYKSLDEAETGQALPDCSDCIEDKLRAWKHIIVKKTQLVAFIF